MYGASGAAPREARGRARERPDVLPAPASLDEPAPPALPPHGKDSVARLTLTGLSYVVTVSFRFSRSKDSYASRTTVHLTLTRNAAFTKRVT